MTEERAVKKQVEEITLVQEASANYRLGIFSPAWRGARRTGEAAGAQQPLSAPRGAGGSVPLAGAARLLRQLPNPCGAGQGREGAGGATGLWGDPDPDPIPVPGGIAPRCPQPVAGRAEFPCLVFMVSPSSDLPQMLTQCHVSDCSLSCAAGG